jgi:cation transport regulator
LTQINVDALDRRQNRSDFQRGAELMPYTSNEDLPPAIRRHLPLHAQDIFRATFNSAWESYGERESSRREEIAHRVAWVAVKRQFRKEGEVWVPR